MVDLTFVERSTLKLCLFTLEKTEGSDILLKVTRQVIFAYLCCKLIVYFTINMIRRIVLCF